MPVFKNRTAFEIARDVRAFLNLEAGITRNGIPEPASRPEESVSTQSQELEQLHRKLESSEREIAELRARLISESSDGGVGGVRPENLIWIFGTGRTGSTWLSLMMGDADRYTAWGEPLVGKLFGDLYYTQAARNRLEDKHFILGGSRPERRNTVRRFILNEATARFPEVDEDGYLVIKEPTGSSGAPPLMEALPESRMIFLIRDFRDIVASFLDATREGAWLHQRKNETTKAALAKRPENFLKQRAGMCARDVSNAKEAYDAHKGHKVLIKYEDLRTDTLTTMKRIYSTLKLPVDEAELARVVEKHSWENIPEELKGEGKFSRKATPGAWREDLTPEQAKMVEEITAPLLKEFYAV